MPCFENVVGFPSPADDLSTFAHATLGPLHFVSLDPAFSFEAWLHGLGNALRSLPLDRLRHDPSTSRVYTVRAHWMLYVENYLEGFHIPFVHPGLKRTLATDQYRVTLYDWSVVQTGYARDAHEPSVPFAQPNERVAAWYVFLFPNLMLNFYPWGLSINVVEPVSLHETRVRYLAWVWNPALRTLGAGASLDDVELEDEAVVEAVHRGVSARRYRGGRYSPSHEQGVHHFHRLVAACLKGLSSENKDA
jgi:choline monooxygenase